MDTQTINYIVNAIKTDIKNSEDMIAKAKEYGCVEAEKWAEGRKDAAEYIKALLQVSGISFN